jgi:lambda family phage minor tail protein L
MTEIIDTVQLQELDDALVDLYEITINGITLYLFNEFEEGVTSIQFNEKESPYTAIEYVAFPLEVTGIEHAGDGAPARPTLTMANVISLIVALGEEDAEIAQDLVDIGVTKNEDLLGARVTRRRTLAKYLNVAGAPVEFPSQSFIIDRVASENNIITSFELASPFDLEGVQLPSRIVVGKYCSWKYQGATETRPFGGCTWPQNSKSIFFNVEDNTVLTGYTTYSSGTSYSENATVFYDNKIWEATRPSLGKRPDLSAAFWKRIDSCPKTVTACKTRFEYGRDDRVPLPFGGFPGTRKF